MKTLGLAAMAAMFAIFFSGTPVQAFDVAAGPVRTDEQAARVCPMMCEVQGSKWDKTWTRGAFGPAFAPSPYATCGCEGPGPQGPWRRLAENRAERWANFRRPGYRGPSSRGGRYPRTIDIPTHVAIFNKEQGKWICARQCAMAGGRSTGEFSREALTPTSMCECELPR